MRGKFYIFSPWMWVKPVTAWPINYNRREAVAVSFVLLQYNT